MALLYSIDENIPLIVETDASDTAISVTLNQVNHPLAYFTYSNDYRRKNIL